MKIIKISAPLPLDEIPIERGGEWVDDRLTKKEAEELEKRFDTIESIGEGQFGIAYMTGSGAVLKLTTDEFEYNTAKELKQQNRGPFAKVYEVGKVKNNVYYILKEWVRPLSDIEEAALGDVIDAVNAYGEYPTYVDQEFIEKAEDYVNEVLNSNRGDVLNVSNIGVNRLGEFVCFDPR